MINSIYILPQETMIGGETRNLVFRLYSQNGFPFSLYGCTAKLAITNYSNKSGQPAITKPCVIRTDAEGVDNVISADLETGDTLHLAGKYIYQVTVVDRFGEAEIPGQGIILITPNIHKSAL